MSDLKEQTSKKLLSCKINGQAVEVLEGTSIIEAYKQLKEDIAHYCWHPNLSIAGVCRLCVVQIEGNPKLQIACNTEVKEGMVVSNQTPQVNEAVRWGLDFHLINHPLDCPICDQAGECGLQEQYMKFGGYDSSMSEAKVRKRKLVDLGPKIVLDAERCILCSRCVRFTEEITKTNELGIFNRGNLSEVGAVKDKPLDNDYTLNTVDICPVGALTSKDFRFQQRVWYLQNTVTTCPGCSTGCSVKVYHNQEGVFRVKPNTDVQPWMCDEGREVYEHTNLKTRLLSSKILSEDKRLRGVSLVDSIKVASKMIQDSKSIAFILTAQHTNEEYVAIRENFTKSSFYHWNNSRKLEVDSREEFDGILKRGDKNPNTKGFKRIFENLVDFKRVESSDLVIAVLPENKKLYPDFDEMIERIKKLKRVIVLTVGSFSTGEIISDEMTCFPMKSFIEKTGTYTGFDEKKRKLQKGISLVAEAVSLDEFTALLRGDLVNEKMNFVESSPKKENEFLNKVEV